MFINLITVTLHHTRPHSDDFLFAEIKKRNRQAFDYLYANYSAALYGVVFQVLRNEEDAHDALQEVFVKIWNNIGHYDPAKSTLFTWMLNVARNHAIDKTRSKSTKAGKLLSADKNYINARPTNTNTLVDAIGLDKMTETLETEQQQVINLLYFQGYTQAEAAEELNIPLGTVKSRARIAINHLRKFFS